MIATFLGGYCCHLKQISPEIVSCQLLRYTINITDKYRKYNSAEISRVEKMLWFLCYTCPFYDL